MLSQLSHAGARHYSLGVREFRTELAVGSPWKVNCAVNPFAPFNQKNFKVQGYNRTVFLRGVLGLILLLAPLSAFSDKLDDWAKSQMAANHIPGMVIGVYEAGRPKTVRAYGFADLEQGVPVRDNTLFEICSITKQFTAASILMLAQDGKLGLDDPLIQYVPELPRSWADVTIREVMQHVSGMRDNVYDEEFTRCPFAAAILRLSSQTPPKPKQDWSYCNMGYWFLGKVIQNASGLPYYSFLQQRIFEPLGMMSTHPNTQGALVPGRARGYAWDPVSKMNVNASMLNDVLGFGHGGLVSNADDLNRWSEALKNGSLLNAGSRAQMLTPALLEGGDTAYPEGMGSLGYGLGVFLGGSPAHRVEKHSGSWRDASAQLTRFLDDDLTVVVLTNEGGWDERPWIGEEIGSFFLSGIQLPEWKVAPDPDPTILAHVLSLAESVARGEPDLSLASASFWLELSNDPQAWSTGMKLRGAQFVQRIPQGKHTIWLYLVPGSTAQLLQVEEDSDGRIAAMSSSAMPGAGR